MIVKPNTALTYGVIASIFLWAATVSWWRDAARLCEGIIILASIVCAKDLFGSLKRRGSLFLLILSAVLLLIMAYANYWANTQFDASFNHDRFSRFYIKLLLFIPIGAWLAKQPKAVYGLVLALVLGLIATLLTDDPSIQWRKVSVASRIDFGFSNAQHAAMYGASVLLVGLSFLPKAWQVKRANYRYVLVFILIILIGISALMVFLTKTRGVWLGLLAAMPVGLYVVVNSLAYFKSRSSLLPVGVSALLSLIVVVGVFQSNAVSSRLLVEWDTYQQVIDGQFDDLPMSSTGIRVKQWLLAVELISDRPLSGYGGGTKALLIAESDLPNSAKTNFEHFHNSYLELAVAYGVFAILFFIAIMGFLLYRVMAYSKQSDACSTVTGLGLTWIVFFIVANLFESYVMYRTGYSLLGIIGGIVLALSLPKPINAQSGSTTP